MEGLFDVVGAAEMSKVRMLLLFASRFSTSIQRIISFPFPFPFSFSLSLCSPYDHP